MQDAHEVAQRQPVVGHHPLDLVELCQVGGVQRLVPEDPIDGEILHRSELLLEEERDQDSHGTHIGIREKHHYSRKRRSAVYKD